MLKTKDRPAPNPSYFEPEQMARYLSDLRQTRQPRPSGARPPPSSKYALRRAETDIVGARVLAGGDETALTTGTTMSFEPAQKLTHRRTDSSLSSRNVRPDAAPVSGRPIAREPSRSPEPVDRPVRRTPSMSYMESGTRWMEKQEVKSLRQALEDMDMEEERRIHAAAQDEAAELVWKHRNPTAADAPKIFPNPDLQKDYRSHLRKGSYQRSHSQDTTSSGRRSGSDGSCKSVSDHSTSGNRVASFDRPTRKVSPPSGVVNVEKRRTSKSYDQLAETVANDIATAHRRSSSGSTRILSGEKKMYMNPNDKIWEDPEEEGEDQTSTTGVVGRQQRTEFESVPVASTAPVPSHARKNPFARVRAQYEKMERANSAPMLQTLPVAPVPTHDRVEIQRNTPSQSRNPFYMSNTTLPPTPPRQTSHDADEVAPKTTPTKDGREIRGDDIRAATTKSRKDYSPNLPRPTMVSDKPGRPIVRFQKQKEVVMEEQQSADIPRPEGDRPYLSQAEVPSRASEASSKVPIPSICVGGDSAASLPTINLTNQPPISSIVPLEDADTSSARIRQRAPTINVEPPATNMSGVDQGDAAGSKKMAERPMPRHAATAPTMAGKSTPHYTPSIRQSGALCAHCALPIAGRILSAAGERFHPGCFVCHECNTNLECVAFYPEPEMQRSERLARIHARQSGQIPEGGVTDVFVHEEAQDGDESLRFYCHLDFHELFSPRCKSCKTPIEGEVIVACGAEWHAGHFFCAQCGDPFDSTMPFVEKDGYAWCVRCHTNRYSSKCRKCKKPVTDVVVKALGADWHGDCFVCTECHGPFDDGRYFLRGDSQDPVCVKCEERRLKA